MGRRRGHGEGSIYRRASDGRWCASLTLPDGRRKTFYAPTRREVAAKLSAAQRAVAAGQAVSPSAQTLEAFLTGWLEDVVARRLRPNSVALYRHMARAHLIPALGSVKLRDLNAQHVQALLNAKEDAGLAPATIQVMHAVLKRALSQAEDWGLVQVNAAARVTAPPVPDAEPRYLSADEARALLAAVRETRDEALYVVALSLGLRQGEILGLRWVDVDLESRELHVRQQLVRPGGRTQFGPPKSARSARTLPLGGDLVAVLHAHRARQLEERIKRAPVWEDHGLVFPSRVGTPRTPGHLLTSFKQVLRAADLPAVTFHSLRHSCATLLVAEGVPMRVVMEILGHANIQITAKVYAHVLDASKRDAVAAVERVLGKKEAS